jgi:hypothetical protein
MTVKNTTIQEKLAVVRNLLNSGNPEKALLFLDRESQHPELANARGVCLMRLNKIDAALDVLREVVFGKFIAIPSSTPALYKANYLTALLLKGFTQMAIEIEVTLETKDHPYIGRLKESLREWKRGLPLHQKLLCLIKLYPNQTVELPFLPGEI